MCAASAANPRIRRTRGVDDATPAVNPRPDPLRPMHPSARRTRHPATERPPLECLKVNSASAFEIPGLEIAPVHPGPREDRAGAAAAPIARLAPGTDAPLSFAQERIWFLDRLG